MDRNHSDAIQKTIGMSGNKEAYTLAAKHGLHILDVTWEDSARFKGSSVGPNISDLTLQVVDASGRPRCMPVIRKPNFSDVTGDLTMSTFGLLVGNEKGGTLKKITLDEYLGNLREYLHKPDSWKGSRTSLLAPDRDGGDADVLVSAQACFLPIPEEGKAEFNPVLFNYQSRSEDPAVLAIMVTREGTSCTIIDNKRDAFKGAGGTWGQRLFHNKDGERCSFTGTRLTDFKAAGGDETTSASAAGREGLNMVLLVQVPLKQRERERKTSALLGGYGMEESFGGMTKGLGATLSRSRGIEDAVIGHGAAEGEFTEIAGLEIERDPRFPIRVTVQFYKGTTDGVVTAEDMEQIAEQIGRVHADAKYVGSLVTDTDTGRSTEWDPKGAVKQPADWWDNFWAKHLEETGETPEQVKANLEELLGKDPAAATKDEILDAIGRLKARKTETETSAS